MSFSLAHLSPTARLSFVIALTGTFFCVEISVGFYTHSLALIADAFHYLNDVVSFVVALTAIRISKHTYPTAFSFGWQRAQLLGAFFNGVFLAALGLSVFLQALERFIRVQQVERPLLVMVVGAVGLTLNVISVLFLHDHGHDHGGGDSKGSHPRQHSRGRDLPSSTEAAARISGPEGPSIHANHRHITNASPSPSSSHSHQDLGMLGVLLHLAGDALNNIGVIAAAAIIQFTASSVRFYADPAISMLISFMILLTSLPLIKSSGMILLQSSPVGVDLGDVKRDLEELPGVSSVHELHIWSLDQKKRIASAHVVTEDAEMEGFLDTARLVGECLHGYGVHSYTLQPEPKVLRTGRRGSGDEGSEDGLLDVRQIRGRMGSRGSLEMREVRRRSVSCQLACGVGEGCRELQCCK
ncbi:MAG: hypothetical protein MMC23_008731 [Stictis urceolatum]|nr:hypothetical protein [Stictis urceolata]